MATPDTVLGLYLAVCGAPVGSSAQGDQEHSRVCSACFPEKYIVFLQRKDLTCVREAIKDKEDDM